MPGYEANTVTAVLLPRGKLLWPFLPRAHAICRVFFYIGPRGGTFPHFMAVFPPPPLQIFQATYMYAHDQAAHAHDFLK